MRPTSRRVLVAAVCVLAAAGVAATWWWTRPQPWRDAVVPPPPLRRALEAYSKGSLDAATAAVRETLERFDAPVWTARARVLAATRLDAAGRAAEALAFLPAPLDEREPLAAHADLLRAKAMLASGRPHDAAEAARRAAGAAGFPDAAEARLIESAAREAAGEPAAALACLEGTNDRRLAFEAARVAERSGDKAGARRRLASLVTDGTAGDTAERALEALVEIEPDPSKRFDAAERSRLPLAARAWTAARRPQSAIALLRAGLPPAASAETRTPEAALAEAEALLRLGRVAEAGPLITRATRGTGETNEGARYLRARADQMLGRSGAWATGLAALARGTGRSPWRLEALSDLAEIADGDPGPLALAAYRRYREAAGEAADPVAVFREGWIAYESRRWADAEAAFARVLRRRDTPPGVRVAALYWTGRRCEATGRAREAVARWTEIVERWPNHYYATLAERRLHRPAPVVPDPPIVKPSPSDAGSQARWLLAARELRTVRLWDPSFAAYRAAGAKASVEAARRITLEGAEAALDAAAGAEAIQFVMAACGERDETPPAAIPRKYWRVILPAPTAQGLEASARAAKMEPQLVASVMAEESAFNTGAVSSAGARGLLQLMPTTAAEIARRIGLRGFRPEALFEPAVNVRLGTLYLADLKARFGSWPKALAAYNAGPARAERWSRPGDDADGEAFTERIPIPATRVYVKRILSNFRLYRAVWPEGFPEETRR